MPANSLVQTRIDPAVKKRAAAVLQAQGITVSDAVRILLTRTANEGALPFEMTASNSAAHDAGSARKCKRHCATGVPPFLIRRLRRTSPNGEPPPSARTGSSSQANHAVRVVYLRAGRS